MINPYHPYPFSFSLEEVHLAGAFYVDLQYAQQHAHALHQHSNKLELLYVYSGDGRYRVGRREYAVHQGDLLICNAQTLHGETLSLSNAMQTYCCALSGLQRTGLAANCLLAPEQRQAITLTQYQPIIHLMMPQIYQLANAPCHTPYTVPYPAQQHNLSPSLFLAEQMAKTVLLMVCEEVQQQQAGNKSILQQKTEELVCDITDYLDQHYTEATLRMSDIGQALHISESYLFHAFKRETGLSPKQYIILRRIGEAQTLLETTDIPIHEIEERLGFSSSCHLTATFKKYIHISPREYRKHYREERTFPSV